MLDEEADETVLGLQVENVELVDPGRNEQQRYRVGLRGERRVLDQLDEALSVDDLPLRDGEVLSWRESFGIGHSHPTLAQIGNQITQAVSHTAATRLQRLAKSRRVRRQKQSRTRRIDQLLDVEHEAMPFGRIGNLPVGFLAKLGGDREIALLKDPEKRVLLPFRRLEAAVGCGRRSFSSIGVASPHQRDAVPIHVSAASCHSLIFSFAATVVAFTGSAIDRAPSVERACVIASHSTGRSFWSGLACHIWSITAAVGSPSTGTWSRAGSGATVTAVSSTMSWTMSCCCASVAGGRRGARDFLRSGGC